VILGSAAGKVGLEKQGQEQVGYGFVPPYPKQDAELTQIGYWAKGGSFAKESRRLFRFATLPKALKCILREAYTRDSGNRSNDSSDDYACPPIPRNTYN